MLENTNKAPTVPIKINGYWEQGIYNNYIGIILSASDQEGQALITCLPCQPNSVKLVFPLIQYIFLKFH